MRSHVGRMSKNNMLEETPAVDYFFVSPLVALIGDLPI